MKRLALVPLVLAAFTMVGLGASHVLAQPSGEGQALAVDRRLACPQCESTRLDVCDRPLCADMRADVEARLERGESPDAIVDSYRRAYGYRALADPPPVGLAAAVPPLAVGAALGFLVLAGLRLRGGRR